MDAMQTDVHETLCLFYNTKKIPHVIGTDIKMRFVSSNSQIYYDNLDQWY